MKKVIQLLCICLLLGCMQSSILKNKENHNQSIDSFNRTVFIGDLYLLGLKSCSPFQNATFYIAQGMSFDMLLNQKCIAKQGNKMTILESIQASHYQKIYLALGDRDIEWISVQMFIKKYSQLIDTLYKISPNAQIYIQNIMTKGVSVSKRNCYNTVLQQLCQKKQINYIDIHYIQNHLFKDNDENQYLDRKTYQVWAENLNNQMQIMGEKDV